MTLYICVSDIVTMKKEEEPKLKQVPVFIVPQYKSPVLSPIQFIPTVSPRSPTVNVSPHTGTSSDVLFL